MRSILSLIVCLVMSTTMLMAQNRTVTGSVISEEDGEPIVGASVVVDGTTNGTVTDVNGEFSIKVSATDETITISYIGMLPAKISAKTSKHQKVVLSGNNEVLDEVMVVGYGTAKKSSFTGSAAQLKAEAIEAHVSSNVTSTLAGATAGVQLMTTSGDPSSNEPKIRIRGIGSMSASNKPLYILDGVPYSGSISNINPNDVESMTVLKDAAANAIYGARGANGVILITTKKGKTGEAKVRFDAKFGSNSRLIPRYDVVTDPGEYYEAVYARIYNTQLYAGKTAAEAYATAQANLLDVNNGGVGYQVYTVPDGETLIGSNGKLNPNATLGYTDGTYTYMPDDWYDETFHNSFRQEYNFSVTGGTEKISAYIGLGFLDDGGICANSGTKRYTARTNLEYQAKKWLRMTSSINYAHTNSEQPGYSSTWGSSGNLFYITNSMGPIYPLYVRDAEGNIMTENGRTVYDSGQTNFRRPSVVGNAVRDNEYNYRKSYTDYINGKWGLILTPVKGLTLTANLGVSAYNKRYSRLYSRFGSSSSTDGGALVSHSRSFDINSQYLANYQITLAEKHNIDVMVGYEQYQIKDQYLEGYNTYLYNPFVGEFSDNATGTTDDGMSLESYTVSYMTEGILSRVQYNYAEKYFLSGSFRRDASSRFAVGHQWGNFGSAGAAWLVNKEEFMDYDWIEELKVKASYGVQGNDNLLDSDGYETYYPYATMYEVTGSKGSYSLKLKQQGNDELTWETSKSFNTGFDFSLFKSKLNGTIEYFSRRTSDMLYYKPVPTSSGISTGEYPANIGEVLNNGIEVELNGTLYKGNGITVAANFNITHYKNEIKELDPTVAENGIKGSTRIYKVGGSLYQAYLYKYAGVDPENGMALFYKEESDGSLSTTNQISKATKFDCGCTLPKVYGGFGLSVSGYGFDLTSQFQYQLGGKYYDGQYQSLMWTQENVGSALHKDWRKCWTPENPSSKYPRWSSDNIISQQAVDCFQIESDYLSVNNITLGYTVPQKKSRQWNIESLRVYVAGENLGVLTKRRGVDPRSSEGIGGYTSGSSSAVNNGYSAMRTLTAGLSVTF